MALLAPIALLIPLLPSLTPLLSCLLSVLSRTFPTNPLHHIVALDSRSEARYVRRQGRGLGTQPIYLPTFAGQLAACCSRPYGGMPGLGPSLNQDEIILVRVKFFTYVQNSSA